eukprot:TRINITY_DN2956_c1_g1_i3.p1 TRINITY_DN2956_c1_g1~~TRINITY_DN2956_c1_g1_i3.p1  ORF type:complete len:536 (-),score=86.33 TRINITY_DN2956_c1_g1_i3:114-1721(-)
MRAKVWFVFVAVVLAGCAVAAGTPREEQQFSAFAHRHGKLYATEAERSARFAVYAGNMLEALRLSRRNNSDSVAATYGETVFADLTQEEFATRFLSPLPEPVSRVGNRNVEATTRFDNTSQATNFNWCRDGTACNTVVQQGDCSSCWAFAAVAALETQAQIINGELPKLSEQQALDCTPFFEGSYGACCGGWMEDVYDNIRDYTTSTNYPYISSSNTCSSGQRKCQSGPVAVSVYDFERVTLSGQRLCDYVYENGPVAAALYMPPSSMLYIGGVLNEPECATGRLTMNHAVVVVGCGSQRGVPYLTLRNSWGPYWGEGGYFRVRLDNACGIGTAASRAVRPLIGVQETCFPAEATVSLRDGTSKKLGQVQLGDVVQVLLADNTVGHREVFSFYERHTSGLFRFIQLVMESASGPLSAYSAIAAKQVQPGYYVWMVTQDQRLVRQAVLAVTHVKLEGAIAPVTEEGTIVVNGVVCSTSSESALLRAFGVPDRVTHAIGRLASRAHWASAQLWGGSTAEESPLTRAYHFVQRVLTKK